jgi:hypothetical protein
VAGIASGGTVQGAVPDPVPTSAPATAFSSARALEHIRVVAKEPHPMRSPANAAVQDYLVRELRAMGLAPQVQQVTAAYYPIPGLFQAGRPESVRPTCQAPTPVASRSCLRPITTPYPQGRGPPTTAGGQRCLRLSAPSEPGRRGTTM